MSGRFLIQILSFLEKKMLVFLSKFKMVKRNNLNNPRKKKTPKSKKNHLLLKRNLKKILKKILKKMTKFLN